MTIKVKNALVTGASSGIGWHFAEALAGRGYNVIAVSNQPARLDDLKKKLEKEYDIRVITLTIDLAHESAAEEVFKFCSENDLEVEVLINNAGMFFFGEIASIDPSKVRSMLALHTLTPAMLCRLFGGQMVDRHRGFLLNISSITAVMPYPGISVYGPTKTFLRHFTRAMRTEMKDHGLNVTCLIPGAVDTALYDATNYNVPLLKKLRIMKSPAKIADAGLDALFKNKAECVPGVLNKITMVLMPLIPQFIISSINRRINKHAGH